MRVGNESYAAANRSFGLTTLRDRHATVSGGTIRFRFRGKSGRSHELRVADRRLARLVARCQDLPGQTLFTWIDEDDVPHGIGSDDVNEYLRRVSGTDVTARDFRTWAGSILAMRALRAVGDPGTERDRVRQVAGAMDVVADGLGNTRAVARSSYVHPTIPEAWARGRLSRQTRVADAGAPATRAEERELLRLLRHRSG
jgi:DNA topoisomerase-1